MVSLKNIIRISRKRKTLREEKDSIENKINALPEDQFRRFRDTLINYAASLFGPPEERGYNLSKEDLLKIKEEVYKMLFPNNNEPCYSN